MQSTLRVELYESVANVKGELKGEIRRSGGDFSDSVSRL